MVSVRGQAVSNRASSAPSRVDESVTTAAIFDQSVALRLGETASGEIGVFADRERPDDQVVEHEGTAVLLIGREIAENVEDTTIDYEEGDPGPRLVIMKD